jgi:hypothetical protein
MSRYRAGGLSDDTQIALLNYTVYSSQSCSATDEVSAPNPIHKVSNKTRRCRAHNVQYAADVAVRVQHLAYQVSIHIVTSFVTCV